MRAPRLLLASLLALGLPATAHAQLPQANQPGIRVSSGNGRVAIAFLDTPAGRRAYKAVAGRTATVRCQTIATRVFGAGPVGVVTAKVRFKRTLSTVRLRLGGSVNLCTLGTTIIATDTTARSFLGDLVTSASVPLLADRALRSGATATVRGTRGAGVVLKNPTSTPRSGHFGVYTNNGTVTTVGVTPAGRRVFFTAKGGEIRTNALTPPDQLIEPVPPRGVHLPSGPLPAAGAPLPASTDPGITGRRAGADALFDLTDAARAAIGTKKIHVRCGLSTRSLIGATKAVGAGDHSLPAAGRPLSIAGVPTKYHLCSLTYGGHLARVALDDVGRVALEEGTISSALERVLRRAAADTTTSYATSQAVADDYPGLVVPLANPDDTPGDLRIGVWSDGGQDITVSAVARTGRRLFLEVKGDTLRTNVFSTPNLP
jgi:hypothetical protein